MLTIFVFGLLAAGAELLGGGFVVLRKNWPRNIQEYLLALGAGFILALVFIELIPESIRAVGASAPLYMLLGYSVIHFFEHTIVGHLHFGEETHSDVMLSGVTSFSTFTGLFIHAFFDGFTISVGMRYDFTLGFLVFVAILLHKLPEGLTIATVMLAAAHKRRTAFLASVAIGVSTMLGIVSVFLLSDLSINFVGSAFAFSAGIALYVGASDLIPEVNHAHKRVIPLLAFAGMLLFYGGALLLGTAHVH